VRDKKILASAQAGDEKLLSGHPSGEIAKRVRILCMAGRNTSGEHFQTVAGAVLQRKRLTIRYHSRSDNTETEREISPQRLTHYSDKTAHAFLRCRLMRRMPRYAEATIGTWMPGAINATGCAALPWIGCVKLRRWKKLQRTSPKMNWMRTSPPAKASSPAKPGTPPYCASPPSAPAGSRKNNGTRNNRAGCWMMAATNCTSPTPTRANW